MVTAGGSRGTVAPMADDDAPVTVVVTRRIKPGCEAAYRAWARGVADVVKTFAGHRGFVVQEPRAPDAPWTLVYRFDTGAHLDAWMQSSVRAEWVARADALAEDGHTHAQFTGLEPFFAPPTTTSGAPPKWKMAVVTGAAVWPIAQGLGALAARAAPDVPALLRSVVVTAGLVVLLTWVVMPRLTKALAPWLFRR